MVLDNNVQAFIMHVTSYSFNLMPIDLAKAAKIALLIAKKIKIPNKSSDFLDIFSKKKALILLEVTKLNQYAIKL